MINLNSLENEIKFSILEEEPNFSLQPKRKVEDEEDEEDDGGEDESDEEEYDDEEEDDYEEVDEEEYIAQCVGFVLLQAASINGKITKKEAKSVEKHMMTIFEAQGLEADDLGEAVKDFLDEMVEVIQEMDKKEYQEAINESVDYLPEGLTDEALNELKIALKHFTKGEGATKEEKAFYQRVKKALDIK
ncbi:MAG: hypothetical protein HQM08_11050 [Candidatus Riflebacteria bacterium]|nr:hypothetical protein [Candidatus Riflebacteria bacterium]